jgi:potassium efflux system protein
MQRQRIAAIALIFILSIAINSYSAKIDTSLFQGDKTKLLQKYETILSKTSKSKIYGSQKTILQAIINIIKNKEQPKAPITKNINSQDNFVVLIKNISDLQLRSIIIKNQINKIEKKLDTLGDTITQTNDNDTELLSYQLQYAFYILTAKRLKEEYSFLQNSIPKWLDKTYSIFLTIKFDDKKAMGNIQKLTKKYTAIDSYIQKLNIENDRLTLLNEAQKQTNILNKIDNAKLKRDSIINSIIDNYIVLYMNIIQNNKNSIEPISNIKMWSKKLSIEKNRQLTEQELKIAYFIAQKKIGRIRLFIQHIRNNVFYAVGTFWHFVKKPLLSVGKTRFSILNLIIAIVIFILGILIGKLYKYRILASPLSKNIPISTKTIISNIGYYIIITIALFSGLRAMGINLSSLAVILGALSVGVGFGLQNMVANFISGIILMLEHSIRIGDYVEIENNIRGVVKDIKMRSTTILTNDNIEVIIPNQSLFQNNVINWTLTEKVRRFKIPFSVAYGTDIDKVEKVVFEALKKSNINYIKNQPNKSPEIKLISMNSSSVDFNLDVWIAGNDIIYPRRTQSKFLTLIYNALYENNITIPFPQMDIHVIEPVRIKKEEN